MVPDEYAEEIIKEHESTKGLHGAKETAVGGVIPDKTLWYISKNLSKDWKHLGRELGIQEWELEAIQLDYHASGVREIAYQMLLKWKKKMGLDATIDTIKHNLEVIGRNDIISAICTMDSVQETSATNLSDLLDDATLVDPTEKVTFWFNKCTSLADDVKSCVTRGSRMTSSSWELEDVNDEDSPENCWLCSIGGYYRIQVKQLLDTMETTGTATFEQVLSLYKEFGAEAVLKKFFDWKLIVDYVEKQIKEYVTTLLPAQAELLNQQVVTKAKLKVLVGYGIKGRTIGRMVVLKACKIGTGQTQYRIIDFQKDPTDPLRITENEPPFAAKGLYVVFQTNHDVYKTEPILNEEGKAASFHEVHSRSIINEVYPCTQTRQAAEDGKIAVDTSAYLQDEMNPKLLCFGRNGHQDILRIYDMKQNHWSDPKVLSFAMELTMSLIWFRGCVYIVNSGDIWPKPSPEILHYNPITNKISRIGKLKLSVCDVGMGALNETIYVVNGFNEKSELVKTVQCYNPDTGACKTVAETNIAHWKPYVFNISNYLCAVGSRQGQESIERYDPVNNEWTIITRFPEKIKFYFRSAIVKEQLFILNDWRPTVFEIYDFVSGHWSSTKINETLKRIRNFHSTILDGKWVFLFYFDDNETCLYDVESGQWGKMSKPNGEPWKICLTCVT